MHIQVMTIEIENREIYTYKVHIFVNGFSTARFGFALSGMQYAK